MTYVYGEIGTTGTFGYVDLDVDNPESAVAFAVETEHPCADDNTCDIAMALEFGFPFVAAYLLQSATETPFLDAVMMAMPPGFEYPSDADWKAWTKDFAQATIECDCGSFVRVGSYNCDNCGGELL